MRAGWILLAAGVAGLVPAGAAAQRFTDAWSARGFSSSEVTQGVVLGDFDGDGWTDIFTSSVLFDLPFPFPDLGSKNRLYRNDGTARFTDVAPAVGLDDQGQAQGAACADYDNDGRMDLYLVRGLQAALPQTHKLYHQLPGGSFDAAPSSYVSAVGAGRSVAWADYDNDGFLDVFVTNGLDSPVLPTARIFLFRNNGDGSFTDVTVAVGLADTRNGYSCAWSDYDNDGDQDLYVANHGFEDPTLGFSDKQPSALYKNLLVENGIATFVDVAAAAGVDNMTDVIPGEPGGSSAVGCAWGDFDGDGFMDLFITNGFGGAIPYPTPNRLYRNNGDGTFDDRSLTVVDPQFAASSYGCTWGDYDNDGNLDLFVTNASIPLFGVANNSLLMNSGFPLHLLTNLSSGSGVDISEWATACASGDVDRDGWLDIYESNGIPGFELVVQRADNLFLNQGGTNHWLELDLVGTLSNRMGIGTRIRLESGLLMRQTREAHAGSGYQSMDDPRIHFGMGSRTLADRITLHWPSGCVQTLTNVAADQLLTVVEDCPPPPVDDILRTVVSAPRSALFPLPVYVPVVAAPWQDPQAVLTLPDSYFYQHSAATADIRLVKAGTTVTVTW